MSKQDQKGKIQTVLGLINPQDLGLTMTHEHLLIDFSVMFNPTPDVTTQRMAHAPVSMENLGWIRQYCYSNLDNLLVLDEDTAIEEATLYQRHGGGAIVDATTIGIGRDPLALARISRGAGVHVVMGAGYYVDAAQPNQINQKDENDIYQEITKDIQIGVGNTGIKAGIIVLIIDILKGAIGVGLSIVISDNEWISPISGLFVITGHIVPVFAKFKGGKGVATAIGAITIIYPLGLIGVLIGILTILFTRLVSSGSIVGSISSVVIMLVSFMFIKNGSSIWDLIFFIVAATIILVSHHENIVRLLNGKENKILIKK